MPVVWSQSQNIRWRTKLPGEGASSPIVWHDRIFLTAARERGAQRLLLCLDRNSGRIQWTRVIAHDWPELTSALTGHAAPTPVTDGRYVVAFFGNAGCVCYDLDGNQKWQRSLGAFESELGIASSPVLSQGGVILVCDHDGDRFRSFDSFIICLDLDSGRTRWKTDRRGLFRSWSTPVLVPSGDDDPADLIVNAQDEVRGYDPTNGELRWRVPGMTGWVTPSPVFAERMVFAASGKDGPTMALDLTHSGRDRAPRIVWNVMRGSPYVCSPLLYGRQLYVHNESGILTCYRAATGERLYRKRLNGKFIGSPVAGDQKVYLTNESGTTTVLRAGVEFEPLASNPLGDECLASPAVSHRCLFIRTRSYLWCIEPTDPPD